MHRRTLLSASALPLLVACAPAALPPATPTPAAATVPAATAVPAPAATPPADPFATPKALRPDAAPKDVPPPDLDAYAAYAKKNPAPACADVTVTTKKVCAKDAAGDLVALRAALALPDARARDKALAALEGCTIRPNVLRGIRAEYMDATCRDAVVDPWIAKVVKEGYRSHGDGKGNPKAKHQDDAALFATLEGYGLAAKLARRAGAAPTYKGTFDKDDVKAFIAGPYKAWVAAEVAAIDEAQGLAFKLGGYGRAVAALASGGANLRLAESFRGAPIPKEIAADAELKDVYEQSLEAFLEPRKRAGRDATLVALQTLAAEGVFKGPEVDAAKAGLSRMYAGRRIDALDGLLLPAPTFAEEPHAGDLPDFGRIRTAAPTRNVRSFTAGLPPTLRLGVAGISPAPGDVVEGLTAGRFGVFPAGSRGPEMSEPLTRSYGYLLLGTRTWHGPAFDQVIALDDARTSPPSPGDAPLARFYRALALALRSGPDSPAEMMAARSPADLNLTHVEALDVVAKEGGPYAGHAAFDAALLLETAPPEKPSAKFFQDLGARFQRAEGLLTDPAAKRRAHEKAEAARELAAQAETLAAPRGK